MAIPSRRLLIGVAAVAVLGAPRGASAGEEPAAVILDTASLWRFRNVWETPELVLPSGEVRHGKVTWARDGLDWLYKNPDQPTLPDEKWSVQESAIVRLPAETPADWMSPGFDDSSWARLRGPMLVVPTLPNDNENQIWKLILMRARFEVTDPAGAGDLTLSLAFRGGVVVYLNGREVTRAFMPKGDLTLYTPAEPYPEEVYFDADGLASLSRRDPRVAGRVRRVTDFRIPAGALKKGVNVLAIANCRTPTLARYYATRGRRGSGSGGVDWGKIGVYDVRLSAATGAAVVPATGAPSAGGLKVWNQSIIQTVFQEDYPDPFAPLRPVRLTAVRNGTFAGQVVVASEQPIRGLKAAVSDLSGPVSRPQASQGLSPPSSSLAVAGSLDGSGPGISASAVRVRYPVPDGERRGQNAPTPFDSLEEFAPAEVPVWDASGRAVQPIWITVTVPADARPGDYAGTVTIRAEGVDPVTVPLALRVIDWTLPDPKDFTARMDIVESPESLAMAYEVPLWSDEHLKLLDKTFALLAPLAAKTVYVTAVRRTHFGNEHAMVRWVRDEAGELQPDFSIMEKYLEVATRHLGAVPGVILYCWEPMESMGHAGGAGGAERTHDKPILITVYDPETGSLLERKGPAWATPESKVFWKKLTDGIQPVLKKRGLEGSLLFGLVGDCRPTKQAMDEITTGVPEARWAIHSHYYCINWQGYEMGMTIALWGINFAPADPSQGYCFGWSNPRWISYYPREMALVSSLVEHRTKLENWIGARRNYTPFVAKGIGPRGLGRLGADFWVVLKDRRGRPTASLAGRYPESYWGQLNLNYGIPYLLGRGKDGPLATVRSEAFRENIQEVEARVYLEKALLDDETKALMGEDLAGRCRTALDERIRMCLYAGSEGEPWFISSDWGNRTEVLFGLAAEVARRLGGRQPNPNMEPEPERR